MKTDKEFVDAVYEKYGRAKAEERRRAARRRRNSFVAAIAACLVLFVGIIGVNQMGGFPFNRGGNDAAPVAQDVEVNEASGDAAMLSNETEKSTEPEENTEDTNESYKESDAAEPYMTDQGLVNEIIGKQGSIRGIEMTKSTGNSLESKFFKDAADISTSVEWLTQNSGAAMSEATFYSQFTSETMPATYYVMSVQFSADPADSIEVYVITDTAPGFGG